MAKGFATAKVAIKEIDARKNSGGGPRGLFFKVEDGGEQVVRPAISEPIWVWVHELPKEPSERYSRNEPCRDQDPDTGVPIGEACPGCDKMKASVDEGKAWKDRDYKKKMAGVLPVIWRDAPVFEEVEDDAGNKKKNYDKVVGKADQIALWTFGKVVIEELEGNAASYGDLMARDWVVKRKGTSIDTVYDIKPVLVDGETRKMPLSEADKKLIESQPDVNAYFAIPSYESWGKKRTAVDSQEEAPAVKINPTPFKKLRN